MAIDKVSNLTQSTPTTTTFFEHSSDFFTLTNLVSSFATNSKEKLSLPNKDYLTDSTDLRDSFSSVSQSAESLDMFSFDFFNAISLITIDEMVSADLVKISDEITTSMFEITSSKLDAELNHILMEFSDGISLFDILTGEDDSSIYQVLSTPDFKLYYPEPFIASPSFVHEEL